MRIMLLLLLPLVTIFRDVSFFISLVLFFLCFLYIVLDYFQVIILVGAQKATLHPDDILLLANFILSSGSFR